MFLTLQDEIWVADTLPFLMFGKNNVKTFVPTPSECSSRSMYFNKITAVVWSLHLHLVSTRTITADESKAMMREFLDFTSVTKAKIN